MSLLTLPTELRLHIYSHLGADLNDGRAHHITRNSRPLPAICQASQQLRSESLPIYFAASFEFDPYITADRVQRWATIYTNENLSHMRTVQLNRHWQLPRPLRGQGHVGFYIKLIKRHGRWHCGGGTSPVVNDNRGLRNDSVQLLTSLIQGFLDARSERLIRDSLAPILRAADVVASHAIAIGMYNTPDVPCPQTETWKSMESEARRVLAVS
ncbi:hypothetical protein MBLNU230_g2165t1 [Neophaeotheca triangularis]